MQGAQKLRGERALTRCAAAIHPVRYFSKGSSSSHIRVFIAESDPIAPPLSNGAGLRRNAADKLFTRPSIPGEGKRVPSGWCCAPFHGFGCPKGLGRCQFFKSGFHRNEEIGWGLESAAWRSARQLLINFPARGYYKASDFRRKRKGILQLIKL